jgi:glycosyltransferase involved in cell wall biosynthesis
MNGTITGTWEVERGICDIKDAANKIIWIYENKEKARIMGLNGRKAVLEQYDAPIVNKKWEELMLKLV